ncbi:hypothetical protein Amal_03649 [Acetobacter malorum]|uniref:Uncharacterized protein n=1 Tax=Acetobacter malorum TaxID=178901 RepID=A0A177G4F1_9PROT|nr:hypothetical protein [Acetobacter malorum]OAG75182.1 hypothetical protein Amal_03649 [Acetobacter malorum]
MSIVTAVIDLETAVLPAVDEKWTPPTEEISVDRDSEIETPYDVVVHLTSDFRAKASELGQAVSHLMLSLNLNISQLIDLMLSGETAVADQLYTKIDIACSRNLDIIQYNKNNINKYYKKFLQFSQNQRGAFSQAKSRYAVELSKCQHILEDKKR